MIPIKGPQYVREGISILIKTRGDKKEVMCEIYYSEVHPNLVNYKCKNGLELVWKYQTILDNLGSIFNYEGRLRKGFYWIKGRDINENNEDDIVIGNLDKKDYLVIGLPYSSYKPLII